MNGCWGGWGICANPSSTESVNLAKKQFNVINVDGNNLEEPSHTLTM